MPRPTRSSSSPIALTNAPDPSASIVSLPSAPCCLPQAPITNASFTAMQAIVSTPFARKVSAFSTKPGRCRLLQVGVNAPGTANRTTVLLLKISSVEVSLGPSGVAIISFMDGIVSPTLIVMGCLVPCGPCQPLSPSAAVRWSHVGRPRVAAAGERTQIDYMARAPDPAPPSADLFLTGQLLIAMPVM